MMKMYLSMSGPCWKKLAFCAFQIVPVPWDVPRHTNVFCAKVCEALAMLPCPSCNSFGLRREVDKKIHSGFA